MGGLDPVAPEQCALLLGIALDDELLRLERAVVGTLAYELSGDPGREQFALDAEYIVGALECLVTVGTWVPSSRSDRFAPIDLETVRHAARSARVLMFLTHHDPHLGLQLGNELVPIQEVAEAIGPAFNGVVDFGACASRPMLHDIGARFPHARWIGFDGQHRLDARVSILRAVQRCLRFKPRPYVEIIVDALEQM